MDTNQLQKLHFKRCVQVSTASHINNTIKIPSFCAWEVLNIKMWRHILEADPEIWGEGVEEKLRSFSSCHWLELNRKLCFNSQGQNHTWAQFIQLLCAVVPPHGGRVRYGSRLRAAAWKQHNGQAQRRQFELQLPSVQVVLFMLCGGFPASLVLLSRCCSWGPLKRSKIK